MDAALPTIPPAYECDVTQSGTVTVRTVTPNIPLLIHDVFGTLVSRTTSGSNGVVVVTVPGCGSVTSVGVFPTSFPVFHTITYVRDGDELFISAPPGAGGQLLGPAHLTIDTAAPGGASSYFILGPISSELTSQPNERNLYWGNGALDAQGLTTFAVQPTDATSGLPDIHAYAVFDNVSLADAVNTPLHVTTWKTATILHQFHVALSEPLRLFNFHAQLWTKSHTFWPYAAADSPMATTHDVSVELSDYGSGISVRTELFTTATDRWRSYQTVVQPSAAIDLDLTDALLPEITGMSVSPSATRPQVSWTLSTGTSVFPDITLLHMRGAINWAFALPPGRTSYQLPELPPDITSQLATDLSSATFAVSLHETSEYPGYAVARTRFVELFVGGPNFPMGFVWRSSRFTEDSL